MLKSILICTYNEETSVLKAIKDIKNKIADSEIILIDDNSSDSTLEKINNSSYNKEIKLIIRKKQKGLASAFLRAIIESNGGLIGWIDTNMTYLLDKFKEMEKQLLNGHADIVVLSRYVNEGGDERNFLRSFSSKILNKFCKLIYRSKINDFSSGIFLMKKEILNEVSVLGYGHGDFFIEFLYNIEKRGFKIIEMPYVQKKEIEPINSKSAPNIFKFAKYGIQYFIRIIISKFRNN